MAHFLNASELAEICNSMGLKEAEAVLVHAAQIAGEAIAKKLGIEIVSEADCQPGFAGLCVGFGPATPGQSCPEEIRDMDPGSDWAEGGDDVPG